MHFAATARDWAEPSSNCQQSSRDCTRGAAGMISQRSLGLTTCKSGQIDQSDECAKQACQNLRLVEEEECSPMSPMIRVFFAPGDRSRQPRKACQRLPLGGRPCVFRRGSLSNLVRHSQCLTVKLRIWAQGRYSATSLTVAAFADGSASSRFLLAVHRDRAFEKLSR